MENYAFEQDEFRDKSAGEVEKVIKDAFFNEDEDQVYEEIKHFLGIEKPTGSPDDFHNLSVNFSRRDDYSTACDILEKGLMKYQYNTDLLADFLQIGCYCNREDKCKYYYKVLMSIPKVKWTWRGFSFSIDYLQIITEDLINEDQINYNQRKMLEIADEYYKYFPLEEDVYLTKSEIYKYYKNHCKEIECLQEAVIQEIKSPKCCLRLADYYFTQGKYEKALEYIERNKVEGIDVQNKINIGYMYYLSGLCRTALIHLNKDFSNLEVIKAIYQDFAITEEVSENYTSFAKNIESKRFILETKSGIKYDDVINGAYDIDESSKSDSPSDEDDEHDVRSVKHRAVNQSKVMKKEKKRKKTSTINNLLKQFK